MSYWAVVQAEAQREHIVRLLLMRANFETYLPRIKVRSRIALLFPSYVFVKIVDQWYSILWTPHVVRLLTSGDRPACCPDEIINDLVKRSKGGFVKLPLANPFKPGQKVRILRGSLQGQIGLYQGQTTRQRERVLLELLGQMVPVELPVGQLALPLNVVASNPNQSY